MLLLFPLLSFAPFRGKLCSCVHEAVSRFNDPSSLGAAALPAASKSIALERNRRKKLNDRLFALRALVPKISKVHSLYQSDYGMTA